MSEELIEKDAQSNMLLPIVVIGDVTFFPHTTSLFDIPMDKNSMALRHAEETDGLIFLSAQNIIGNKNLETINGIYKLGTVAKIKSISKKDGINMLSVSFEVLYRAKMNEIKTKKVRFADISRCEEIVDFSQREEETYIRLIKKRAVSYSNVVRGLPKNFFEKCYKITDLSELTDYVIFSMFCRQDIKQLFLQELNVMKRAEMLVELLQEELNTIRLEQEIEQKLKKQLDKNQRDYQLREKINVISKELGDDNDPSRDAEIYRKKIERTNFGDNDTAQKLLKECDRLAKLPPFSNESGVIRTYLDTCIELPWNKTTKDTLSVEKVKKQLDKDHFGLEDVKERILETIAVKCLAPDLKGQILCLVGPPGVGKTSIAKSIATALNKKFARISLGGVRDEAEIRGHRRTYIGAMPGCIIKAMNKADSKNPLILLDEIDKLGSDYKGDPAAALLEVLDGEQNTAFLDHYLDIPFDLSEVMFLTTANDMSTIPAPLRDRMEIINLSSYTAEEKLNIAKKYLVKKQMKKHGLTSKQINFTDKALIEVIQGYTREAGVRTLERTIASVCRKAAKQIVMHETEKVRLNGNNISEYLGARKYKIEETEKVSRIGVVNGLAWTSVGGTLLEIEVSVLKGEGKIQLTGRLGEVMRESANIAISLIRSIAHKYGIDPEFYKKYDIHIHAPEGAVPKDGPSAGVTMATAILSALTEIPVKADVAMTGEISLRGKVMPIGGLKEKSMAAYLRGIKKVIIPADNLPDLDKISDSVKDSIEFVSAEQIETVFENALEHMTYEGNNVFSNKNLAIAASQNIKGDLLTHIPTIGDSNEDRKSTI